MGRLSAYAKNRILKLRFKKNKRIIHIVEILRKDDNIKVSRQAVSTFLKKYLETNSIYDKPRTGRKRKLTQEEIQLIGQVTRLNRDITARAIKEYLNLNVSTYTILRATKLFEWNKINPNSNDSKKAAALERQLNGEVNKSTTKSVVPGKRVKRKSTSENLEGAQANTTSVRVISMSDDDMNMNDKSGDEKNSSMNEIETVDLNKLESSQHYKSFKEQNSTLNEANFSDPEKVDLNLLTHKELLTLKNLSCSPMSFATKILFKIFKIEELHGHNVSGKTLNKNLKAKLPLDTVRIGYIKYLVEKYYDEKECKEMLSGVANHKQDLWKSCHTAINKSILISERKAAAAQANGYQANAGAANMSSNGIQQLTNACDALNDSEEHYKSMSTDNLDDKDDSDMGSDDDEDDDDDEFDEDSDSDSDSSEYDLIKKEKFINKKNLSKQANNSSSSTNQQQAHTPQTTSAVSNSSAQERRRSDRLKKPTQKYTEQEDGDDEQDEEDEKFNDENGAGPRIKDEDEVELIQNIENRQKAKQSQAAAKLNVKSLPSSSSKQPLSTITPQTPHSVQSPRLKRRKQDQETSSEASAAANIAAAMKKRLVVVASNQKNSS